MDPYFLGQLALMPYGYLPYGWMDCDGKILPQSGYTALYSLIGNTYGGSPGTNFALPDLRGRAIVCAGSLPGGGTYVRGQMDGAESVTISAQTMPAHIHALVASSGRNLADPPDLPTGKILASISKGVTSINRGMLYFSGSPTVKLWDSSLQPTGNGQPHNNMQPSLALRYCIAVTGNFPSFTESA
jgi:microcystin-dependent protein